MHTPETKGTDGAFTSVERMIEGAAVGAERAVLEYRNTAFQRFPLLFAALALFGGVATVFGLEQILSDIALFKEHPVFTLLLGLAVLGFTGALYKKLS
jgi:hypothetical protein